MPPYAVPALLSVLAMSLLSVLGAVVLLGGPRARAWLPLLVALAAGALLGDTFLHLLPHAVAERGGFDASLAWGVLAGLVGFFVIEGLLHWHHHGEDVHEHGPEGLHSFGWMNLIGDGLHNLIDGMLIASAWIVGPEAGLATTVAVALHEIPQEFGDFGVLLHAGFSPRRAILLNLGVACLSVLGCLGVLLVHDAVGLERHLVPLAAGGFLYIACADLVPEMRARARGAALLPIVLALLLGVGLMAGVHEVVHSAAAHEHGTGPAQDHDHDHDHGPDRGPEPGSDPARGTPSGPGPGGDR